MAAGREAPTVCRERAPRRIPRLLRRVRGSGHNVGIDNTALSTTTSASTSTSLATTAAPTTLSPTHAASASPCAWQRPQRRRRHAPHCQRPLCLRRAPHCQRPRRRRHAPHWQRRRHRQRAPRTCRVFFAVCVAAATTSASTRTALSTTTAPATCPTRVPRLLRRVCSGSQNVGVDKHFIGNVGGTSIVTHAGAASASPCA